ncbi:MAG: spore cortex biosynthesis protein YabQ [Oscillospiraceae bacterium]|nr:spore cortex biosynthesis protein YabQ [Oscillospiraceae bacterium]
MPADPLTFTNLGQLQQLLLAVGMGLLLGVFYDLFRVIRIVMASSARVIFFQDMAFFSAAAVMTFLFALAINAGRLRLYLFFGMAIGFGVYYLTVGRLVVRFAGTVTRAVAAVWSAFWRAVFWPFRKLFVALTPVFRKFGSFLANSSRKCGNIFKKGLQKVSGLVYTKKDNGKSISTGQK